VQNFFLKTLTRSGRQVAYNAAEATLKSGWSGTGTADYSIRVAPPGGIGQPGTCQVSWKVTMNFLPLSFGWSSERLHREARSGKQNGKAPILRAQKGQSTTLFAFFFRPSSYF